MQVGVRKKSVRSTCPGKIPAEARAFYAEVTCGVTRETPAEQGFHCFRGWAFWLLQGQWDRGVDEFEGAALGGGGFGQGGHDGCSLVVAVA